MQTQKCNHFCFFRILWCLVISLSFSTQALAQVGLAEEQLLELMRANDAQFDNVLIKYRYTDYEEISRQPKTEFQTKLVVDPSVDTTHMPSRWELIKWINDYYAGEPGKLISDRTPPQSRKWLELVALGKIGFVVNGMEPSKNARPTFNTVTSDVELALRWPDFALAN